MSFWWFWTQPPVVEEALDEDLPKIAEIHAASFAHNWHADEFGRMKAQDGVTILVARRASPYGTRAPLGFVVLRTVADEAEVITIAVQPRQRGRGVGKKLMEASLFRLYAERCSHLFLEVDAANEAALLLYRGLGFKEVGKRKGYYSESGGDGTALVMRIDLR
ncbi:ribosomal protein S18-alanine N-acetyltransferase [Roseibium porphyridii]|uniref:Ribosomal protein S18-alanine N-acetyltransferase n=1 Tax=Roseibium porphyridii TaxID=2866279 RepID=A0ABY8F7C8_9HYPH|nr:MULTISPECIES: ribosomal protein S18-alanine N-acetyltransferase [Stappiaceae]QFT34800.1 ribosomal-protein-alanine N-acetyltransferase [Labrenzia sp. THAF82]WFE89760.1 ribosomal protein S18-alanine N-acetyltransferase [Roseibium sp. KMA01]